MPSATWNGFRRVSLGTGYRSSEARPASIFGERAVLKRMYPALTAQSNAGAAGGGAHGGSLMKKVAVFGNAGGGKSALAQRLAELTGLPLYVVDMMQFRPGGAKVPHDEFVRARADILRRNEWIIDGFGNMAIAWERFAAADTLIHVDLPLFIHFRWVTKRLIKGLFADPPGWPEDSPLWSSSVQSYRVLWLCHRHLTPKYRQLVAEGAASKKVHRLRSPGQICSFLKGVKKERLNQ